MNDFYQAALEIAKRKMFSDTVPGKLHSPRIGTGGGFVDIFLWDTVFCCHWAKYHAEEFPLTDSLDNFYMCQEPDGFISRQIHSSGISKWSKEHPISFAPPLFSWIELDLHESGKFPGRLEKVYPHLVRLHEFNRKWRRDDGLYFSDMWGCGMDDIPRWNSLSEVTPEGGIVFERKHLLDQGEAAEKNYCGMWTLPPSPKAHTFFFWNRQLAWVDTNAQVTFDTDNLRKMALALNRPDEAAAYEKEYQELKELINEKLYDERSGFYCDLLKDGWNHHLHVGGFWTLISGVATPERAARLFEHLRNPKTFGQPCGVPGLPPNDPDFDEPKGYWRGKVWCPTEYMVLCGLRRYGETALAKELAQRFHNAGYRIWKKTGTIWENYSCLQSDTPSTAANRDFCGWSALLPITIFREFC